MRMRTIPNWPKYQAADDGRIWGNKRNQWLSLCRKKHGGYIRATLWRDGQKTVQSVHRLVLAAFVGSCPDGMEACHNNGNPADNRLENLRWASKAENGQDTRKHGRHLGIPGARGENSGMAKLTKHTVRSVRYLLAVGWPKRRIANLFGVTEGAIRAVAAGRSWAWLT